MLNRPLLDARLQRRHGALQIKQAAAVTPANHPDAPLEGSMPEAATRRGFGFAMAGVMAASMLDVPQACAMKTVSQCSHTQEHELVNAEHFVGGSGYTAGWDQH